MLYCKGYDLRKPLPLIPNSQGRRVIPFDHFINNDLEYLSGGVSSHKYTTLMTKTKAAYYRHIKWIEDLVPKRMWSQVPVSYDKHALWGISHWGRKRQQFYGFAVNKESARDVYSKRRIIAIIELEDMLFLLVHGKLTNLTVEECLAFNVSLRMFTRSIVIQRRVEDLQLAYSNPRGFIYQNKDKKNRLMRIDELHKFSDGTLNDVRTALDDRLKGIWMNSRPEGLCGAWRNLLVGDRTRETFDCYKGPYDLSYDVLIITEHAKFDEPDTHVLKRFDTSAGNSVKEILLKLNLPDHRLLKDGGEAKNVKERFPVTLIRRLSRSDKSVKLKNLKKDALLKLFKFTYQERCSRSHSSQDRGTSSNQKSMITTSNHKLMIEVKRAQD
ncbi:hypothetical protein Tco_0409207 [Tanacetum coccineum]